MKDNYQTSSYQAVYSPQSHDYDRKAAEMSPDLSQKRRVKISEGMSIYVNVTDSRSDEKIINDFNKKRAKY